MTDDIDLDEFDTEETEDEERNDGDWLWREDADPAAEPDPEPLDWRENDRVPHVPRESSGSPVGIPKEGGGAGAGAVDESAPEGGGVPEGTPGATREASGPHGGDADEMTLAFTYEAMSRLASPAAALASAEGWTDWVGLVGDVPAHTINKFQREHTLDLDFFSGSGTTAAERLAEIDETSMFYADRQVVVGTEEEEALADRAGWEFVSLEEAAAKADWALEDG